MAMPFRPRSQSVDSIWDKDFSWDLVNNCFLVAPSSGPSNEANVHPENDFTMSSLPEVDEQPVDLSDYFRDDPSLSFDVLRAAYPFSFEETLSTEVHTPLGAATELPAPMCVSPSEVMPPPTTGTVASRRPGGGRGRRRRTSSTSSASLNKNKTTPVIKKQPKVNTPKKAPSTPPKKTAAVLPVLPQISPVAMRTVKKEEENPMGCLRCKFQGETIDELRKHCEAKHMILRNRSEIFPPKHLRVPRT